MAIAGSRCYSVFVHLVPFIRVSHGNGIIGPHCHFLAGLVRFTAQPKNRVSNYIVNANGLIV